MRRLGRPLVVVAAVLLLAAMTPAARASSDAGKDATFYVVSAHPDDEFNAWGYIETLRESDYVVQVTMTAGGTTQFCDPMEDARSTPGPLETATMLEGFDSDQPRSGAYGYQGPDSPTDPTELDKGERHPYGDPWVGRGTEACRKARIASWHWFLDDMTALTPNLESLDIGDDPWAHETYKGISCPPWQVPPTSQTLTREQRCIEVWANERTARVVFRLPEMAGFADGNEPSEVKFTADDVTAGLQALRSRRALFGIPRLPERGILSAAYYATEGGPPSCFPYPHLEHKAVHDAIRYHDQGVFPRLGAAGCVMDPYVEGASSERHPIKPTTLVDAQWVDPATEQRIGPLVVNFGWLFSTYLFNAPSDHYWRVDE